MRNRLRNSILVDYILIVAGTGLMGLSVRWFFDPADMVPGGFTGIAFIVNRLSALRFGNGIPVGVVNLVINIPLLIAAIKIRGWKFISRTVVGAVLYSVWMLIIPEIRFVAEDYAITSVIGGAVMGVGMGLVFLGMATTGGTDTVAALIQKKKPYLNTAAIYPVLDGVIIVLAIWIFGVKPSLYAALGVFISGRVTNWTISGIRGYVNLAYIISDHFEVISDRLMHELDRGVTLLKGKGMYTDTNRAVLMCAVSKRQTADLKRIVYDVDERAFVILSDAKDIRGEGFKPNSADEL